MAENHDCAGYDSSTRGFQVDVDAHRMSILASPLLELGLKTSSRSVPPTTHESTRGENTHTHNNNNNKQHNNEQRINSIYTT